MKHTYEHEHSVEFENSNTFTAYQRTIIMPGIHAINGILKDGTHVPLSLRFDSKSFDKDRIDAYLLKNKLTGNIYPAESNSHSSVNLIGLTNGISVSPIRSTPIVRIDQSKRSNDIPDGALGVYLFVSTEEIDYYGTRVLKSAIRNAIPRYLHNRVMIDGQTIYQGAVRAQHDPDQPIGYVRKLFEYEVGFLALVIVPACSSRYQEMVKDHVLVGGSIGWDPIEWNEPGENGSLADYTSIRLVELSLVDAPATPGTDVKEIEQRAKRAIGIKSRLFRAAELPSPISIYEKVEADNATEIVASDTSTASLPVENATTGEALTQNNNKEAVMPYSELNGFIWVDLRPESDFVVNTLRYGIEDLATGIILRGGQLLKRNDESWNREAVQRVGFNMNSGGWTQDQVSDFMMASDRAWWWNDQSVAMPDMPQARSKVGTTLNRIAQSIGMGKTPQEKAQSVIEQRDIKTIGAGAQLHDDHADATVSAATGSKSQGEEKDMTKDEMSALLTEHQKAMTATIEERITKAVNPVVEKVTQLETRITKPAEPVTVTETPTPKIPTGAGAGATTLQTPIHDASIPSQIRSKKTGSSVHIRDLIKR